MKKTQLYLFVTNCWLAILIKNTFVFKIKYTDCLQWNHLFDYTIDNFNIEIYIVVYSLYFQYFVWNIRKKPRKLNLKKQIPYMLT